MANLSKREAANLIITTLRNPQNAAINIPASFISTAAAAGVAVQTSTPATDPITTLTAAAASPSQLASTIQNMVVQYARTVTIRFTRTGTWNLIADPSGNQGQAHYDSQVGLPRPGTVNDYVGYVPGFSPISSQLVPAAPGYTVLGSTQNASRSALVNLLNNLAARLASHRGNVVSVSYCHTNCHNNCHSSRGRR